MKKFSKNLIAVFLTLLISFSFAGQVWAVSGWTQIPETGEKGWTGIASSSDGVKLVAIAIDAVYTSTDSGATWTSRSVSGLSLALSVASSSDGVKLVIGDGNNGYIYTSTDSGATWTERTGAGTGFWYSISSSSDGTKLIAVNYNGSYPYTSTDSGATWTQQTHTSAANLQATASSSDGTKLVMARSSPGYIYTSTNSGVTWTQRTGAGQRSWYSISSSSDGVNLAAVDRGGYIYTSTDSGVNWTEQTDSGARNWYGIASSSDGVNLVASDTSSGGYVYISTDSGATWTASFVGTLGSQWHPVASSADGTKLFAGKRNSNEYLYVYGTIIPAVITTEPASNINKTSATLNADNSVTSGVTARGFEYGLTTSYGSTNIASSVFNTGDFSSIVSSLACDTTYHYRAYATNVLGTVYGNDSTFTTDCSVSPITTGSASTVGKVYAIVNETVDNVDAGFATELGFEYGLTTSYGSTKIRTDNSEFDLGDYAVTLAPLSCATTYHYRAYMIDPDGTSYGDDATFTTATCPTVESNQILYAVDGSDSNNTPTLYKLDPESGSKVETIGQVGFNVTGLAFHPITGVLYGSTGENGNSIRSLITINTTTGLGTLLGTIKTSGNTEQTMLDISFKSDGTLYGFSDTDDSLHIIDISSCNGVACTTSQVGNTSLDGYGNGLAFNNSDELYVFWNGDNSFDQLDPDTGLSIGSTNFSNPSGESYSMSAAVFDANNVLYASRVNYDSSPSDLVTVDVSTGEITSFGDNLDMIYMDALAFYTAPVVSPTVVTTSATSISNSSVVLTGNITRGGYAANTIRGFEYGLTTSYGSVVSETGTLRIGSYSLTATGLTCATTYHYRAYSTNTAGTGTGSDDTFTTSTCPVAASTGGAVPVWILQSMSDALRNTSSTNTNTQTNINNTNTTNTKFQFTKNLKYRDRSTDVLELQKFLNSNGFPVSPNGIGSKGFETAYFGLATKSALIKYQKANNIKPAVGYFGVITRGVVNALSR